MAFTTSWQDILGFVVGVAIGLGIFIWFVASMAKKHSEGKSSRDE